MTKLYKQRKANLAAEYSAEENYYIRSKWKFQEHISTLLSADYSLVERESTFAKSVEHARKASPRAGELLPNLKCTEKSRWIYEFALPIQHNHKLGLGVQVN
jgi:hypothetical protein